MPVGSAAVKWVNWNLSSCGGCPDFACGALAGRPSARRKVPIDPLHSRASHRHARLKLWQTRLRSAIFSAPHFSVLRKNGLAPQSSPATCSCSEPTPRNGLSLAHPGYLFPGCRHEVAAPGHILRRPLKFYQARSVFSLLHSIRLAPDRAGSKR
jgi:hypothetical protein